MYTTRLPYNVEHIDLSKQVQKEEYVYTNPPITLQGLGLADQHPTAGS
jgi:hypothetical protein